MKIMDSMLDALNLVRKADVLPMAMRSFEGAAVSRLTTDFLEASNEIDQDIRAGGKRLRNRARHLVVNNAYAGRAAELYVSNVAGECGHTFQADIRKPVLDPETKEMMEESDDDLNTRIENIVADFSKPENCSVSGKYSFGSLQRVAAFNRFTDGEFFLRRVWSSNAKYGFYLEPIAPENIAEDYNIELSNGNVVKLGVELDAYNRPVAYWCYKRNRAAQLWGPARSNLLIRVLADDMLHWFDPRFTNQTRGFTKLAPVMLQLHWMRGYGDASVLNAKISASKLGLLSDVDPENPTAEIIGTGKDTKGNTTIKALPGSFQNIGAKKLWQWDPKYPHGEHEMFMRQCLREIAGGVSASYSALSGDYSQHNFSSQRGESENVRRNYIGEQESMITHLNDPIFKWLIEGAIMTGHLKLQRFSDHEKVMRHVFIGPRWDYINPVDETNATRSDLEAALTSPFEVAARKGRSYEDILRDRRAARKLEKKYGETPVYGKTGNVSTDALTPATPPAPAPVIPQTTE